MYPNLKLELWRKGMRQNRLAKILGIDESVLSRIVNGFRVPDPQIRTRIAEALGTNEQWLFEEPLDEKNTYSAGCNHNLTMTSEHEH